MKMHAIDIISSFLQKYIMFKKYARILSALVLVVYMLVAALSVEGSVLCFGGDGHVAVEFVGACNGSGFGSQLAGMESDSCGPCKDVQFFSSPAYTRNASHDTQTFPLISLSLVSLSLPLKACSRQHINLPEYPHDTTLASLHSVILLI